MHFSDPSEAEASVRPANADGITLPLFHAAWLFAAGIAAARLTWMVPAWLLAGIMLTGGVCCAAGLRAQRLRWLPLGVLWLLLGAWCAEMEPAPAPAPALAKLSDNLLRTVEGTVVDVGPVRGETEESIDEGVQQAPAQRIDLRVNTVEVVTDEEDAQKPVEGMVRLTVRWPEGTAPEGYRCGQRLRAVAQLLRQEDYHTPGAWSRREYLLQQGITSTASVHAESVEGIGEANGRFLPCRIHAVQHAMSTKLLALPARMRRLPRALRLDKDDAAMLAAMVTGDRTFLTHTLRAGFERTGSFHMLVVSGFHLAIVAGCILWIARRARLPEAAATLVTIAATFSFAMFTGFATPVQRSLWMVTLYLIGRLVYRERNAMNTIGFAALCLLAASPRSLFDAGLQMTLLAVLAIGGIAAPLLRATVHPYLTAARDLRLVALDVKLAPRQAEFRVLLRMLAEHLEPAAGRQMAWRWMPWVTRAILRGIELLVVASIVELAMALPMAVYFHRITVFALPVNMVIFPLLIVLMPMALLVLALLAVWPAAAVAPAVAAGAMLHLGVWLVRLFGEMRLGDLRIPAPGAWQQAAFWVLLAAAIGLALRVRFEGVRWPRQAAWAALTAGAVIVVIPRAMEHPRDALLVEAIDVGQGDSLLLITPEGRTLLVDGGGFGGGPRQATQEFDIGEEVVSQALWARGIRRLDAVALSHAHSDHMGGLPAVLRNFRPRELWVGNNPRVASYVALLDEAAELGVQVRELRAGDELKLGELRVSVLAPMRDYVPEAQPGNNDSLVLRAANGEASVLLEGDAEAPVEEAMTGEDVESTLLKVGHHGSITSTRPEFLAMVKPQWAVISCGLRNRFRHPRSEVLAELEQAHVRTLSTDISGTTCFRLHGKTAEMEPGCAASEK